MRFLCLLAVLLPLSVTQASTQEAAPAAPPSGAAQADAPKATVDDLIRLLENDKARNELVSRLRERTADGESEAAAVEAEPGFARRIAEYTRAIAENTSDAVTATVQAVRDVGTALSGASSLNLEQVRDTAIGVGLTAAALFASFLVLRLIVEAIQSAIARRAEGRRWSMRLPLLVAATLFDLAGVALAWGAGYLLALQLIGGTTGRMGINQTLLLNAFLMVEVIKAGMRTVLEPRHPPLRFLPVGDESAAYWYFWSARIVSLLGYTFMFVAPVVAGAVSPVAAQAVRVIVMLTAAVIAVIIVLQNRDRVRAKLSARATAGRHDALSRFLAVFGHYWHLIAITYIVGVFAVWLVNPRDALPFMMAATAQSIIAVIVGVAILAFISRFVNFGMRLPDDIRAKLPLLESRLRAFVPLVMRVVRTLVLVGVVIAVAQAWGLVDFIGWAATETGQRVTGSVVSAALILLVGFAIYLTMSSWVEYRLNPNFGTVPTAREKTLLSLFRNAFTIALVVMVAMLALAQIGVNIAPLLAGAGVLGLAIGFGAQKFVQDIITGAFIQFENIMNEGDVVEAGGKSGVVERLTIRSVSIRSLDGTLHLIPFSSVDAVSNMMKGFSFHVAAIGVAYREDISEVKEAMHEAFDMLMETEHRDNIIGPLEMQGITEFADSAITVRARIKTLPGKHWGAGRAYNEFIKTVFDRRGIEIPFPHVTLYMGEDKKGNSPPLRIARPSPDKTDALPDATKTPDTPPPGTETTPPGEEEIN